MSEKTKRNVEKIELPNGRFFDYSPDDSEENQLQSVAKGLCKDDLRFAAIIECGDCCQKVLNIDKIHTIGRHSYVFVADKHDHLLVKVFSHGKVLVKEVAQAVIVPRERICSLEVQPLEIDN